VRIKIVFLGMDERCRGSAARPETYAGSRPARLPGLCHRRKLSKLMGMFVATGPWQHHNEQDGVRPRKVD